MEGKVFEDAGFGGQEHGRRRHGRRVGVGKLARRLSASSYAVAENGQPRREAPAKDGKDGKRRKVPGARQGQEGYNVKRDS